MSRLIFTLTAFLLSCTIGWAQGLHQFEQEFIKITRQLRPSVVQVTAELDGHPVRWSGVVLDAAGHIATAGHVLGHLDHFKVKLLGGQVHSARKIGYDPVTSLGVLKVDGGKNLVPVKVAKLEEVRVGSIAIVVGNPFGFTGSVSTGIISGRGRTIESRRALLCDMLQTTAPINPGDSGGLLANSRGQMVGIITSTFGRGQTLESLNQQMQRMMKDRGVQKQMQAFVEYIKRQEEFKKDPQKLMEFLVKTMKDLQKSGVSPFPKRRRGFGYGLSAQGINFVMPVDQVQRIAQELIKHGNVSRAWLGVIIIPDQSDQRERLVVNSVAPEGPAARAGLLKGDELVKVAGRSISSLLELRRLIQGVRPGEKMEFRLRRGKKEIVANITLDHRR